MGYRVKNATAEDYKRLDKELAYAEKALSDAEIHKLAGVWKAEVRDQNYELQTHILEIVAIDKRDFGRGTTASLNVTLKNWGDSKITLNTEYGWITANTKTILNVDYQGMPGVQLRPIAPNKMRYSYMDSCALNFPNSYNVVFKRVVTQAASKPISKKQQSRSQGSRGRPRR